MVDAPHSKCGVFGRPGSNPGSPTMIDDLEVGQVRRYVHHMSINDSVFDMKFVVKALYEHHADFIMETGEVTWSYRSTLMWNTVIVYGKAEEAQEPL